MTKRKFIDQTLEIIANEKLKSSNKVVQTESALETTPRDKKNNRFINKTPDIIKNEHVQKCQKKELIRELQSKARHEEQL
ncbi:5544_t:CDS:1, partial [Cetraspora pellucida]